MSNFTETEVKDHSLPTDVPVLRAEGNSYAIVPERFLLEILGRNPDLGPQLVEMLHGKRNRLRAVCTALCKDDHFQEQIVYIIQGYTQETPSASERLRVWTGTNKEHFIVEVATKLPELEGGCFQVTLCSEKWSATKTLVLKKEDDNDWIAAHIKWPLDALQGVRKVSMKIQPLLPQSATEQ